LPPGGQVGWQPVSLLAAAVSIALTPDSRSRSCGVLPLRHLGKGGLCRNWRAGTCEPRVDDRLEHEVAERRRKQVHCGPDRVDRVSAPSEVRENIAERHGLRQAVAAVRFREVISRAALPAGAVRRRDPLKREYALRDFTTRQPLLRPSGIPMRGNLSMLRICLRIAALRCADPNFRFQGEAGKATAQKAEPGKR
jgi:hypothetical protein